MLIEAPKCASASTLSPSVTATPRMLSPNRATFSVDSSARPSAARTHEPIRRRVFGSLTCPAMVLREVDKSRLDVAEFAVAVGGLVEVHEVHVDALPWQLDAELGVQMQQRLRSDLSPRIHILAGEKVCIQAMTPMHSSEVLASLSTRAICVGRR